MFANFKISIFFCGATRFRSLNLMHLGEIFLKPSIFYLILVNNHSTAYMCLKNYIISFSQACYLDFRNFP